MLSVMPGFRTSNDWRWFTAMISLAAFGTLRSLSECADCKYRPSPILKPPCNGFGKGKKSRRNPGRGSTPYLSGSAKATQGTRRSERPAHRRSQARRCRSAEDRGRVRKDLAREQAHSGPGPVGPKSRFRCGSVRGATMPLKHGHNKPHEGSQQRRRRYENENESPLHCIGSYCSLAFGNQRSRG